ncbi:MAG: hypothetical protein AAF845_06110 [Bacteroidota bacterium]
MTRLALLVLLASGPALAQTGDATLQPSTDALRADRAVAMHLAATAALAHTRTGTFPASAFDLLGRSWSADTGVRDVALSSLDVTASADGVQIDYVPLPAPYVREDDVVRVTLRPEADGSYRGTFQVQRRADADDGGRALPFDVAGRYRVERASGTFHIEADRLGALVAEGRFSTEAGALSREPLTMRVTPLGETEPVFWEVVEAAP